ncbi:MAG: ABC transporter substrate-binding protein [Pseudomonadota bacterium]
MKLRRRCVFGAIGALVFGGLAAVSAGTALSADPSLETVKTRGALIVGTDIPYGVMQFIDASGKPAGIDIEIAQEITADLGVKLTLETMPFKELFGALKAGRVDAVISAVTITEERQKEMLFSAPYMDAGMSIAVAETTTDVMGEKDLTGKTVGVLAGTVGEKLMTKSAHVEASNLKRYENNDERLKDLVNGKIDAAIVHFVTKRPSKIKLLSPPLTQSFYGVVTKLGDEALMDAVNFTLRRIKRDGRLEDIKNKYINQ